MIEATQEENSQRIHKEDFAEIFVPFVALDGLEENYRLMNTTLKKRAEETNK